MKIHKAMLIAALCVIVAHLSEGTLTAEGLLPAGGTKKTPLAITAGTGAYDGARGTALTTDISSTSTDIQITLRPSSGQRPESPATR